MGVFNAKTFSLNFNYIDHYGLKPAAKVWSEAFPQRCGHSLSNAVLQSRDCRCGS